MKNHIYNIKVLIRAVEGDPTKGYWFTVRWIEEGTTQYGNIFDGYLTKNMCFDSKIFIAYRECRKDAYKLKRTLEIMEWK